jgi:uncharacterized membrane protein YhaH (DUF805 family)
MPFMSLFVETGESLPPVAMVTIFFIAIVWIWIHLAITVKRFHDMNKSGWWVLLDLIPYLGTAAIVVLCGFFSGTKEANKYGQPLSFRK